LLGRGVLLLLDILEDAGVKTSGMWSRSTRVEGVENGGDAAASAGDEEKLRPLTCRAGRRTCSAAASLSPPGHHAVAATIVRCELQGDPARVVHIDAPDHRHFVVL
jgi:hypothetical protein